MSLAKLRGAAHAPAALAVIAAAVLVGACSKGEPQSTTTTKARPNAPVQSPQAGSAAQRAADVESTLAERLARQEAASKLFEKEALKAPPPSSRVPEPAKAAPGPPKAAASEAKKAEPAKALEPPKVAAVSAPAPAAEPAKEAPAAPPRVEVAAAKPAALAPAPAARLISRVDPDFPREAAQAGVANGNVKARMTLDTGGNVTRVEVVEAFPRRLFDRAVVRALSQWRFSDGLSGRTVETEVEFKLEK